MDVSSVVLLVLLAGGVMAQSRESVENAVLGRLSAQFGIRSRVIVHLDLTETFQTKSPWRLVVAKQPDEAGSAVDGLGERMGAVSFCFVENGRPDCSEELLVSKLRGGGSKAPAFHEFIATKVVFAGQERTQPLLLIQVCESRGATGNCGVSTYVIDYDRTAGKFRVVFFGVTGRNNNEETRLLESGPLQGSIVRVTPTNDPPYTFFVEVYQRRGSAAYERVLRYRGKTGYGDGNPLAVIDSEMVEILRRQGFWKEGDRLPVPERMPKGCGLELRKGVVWCVKR